MQSFQSLEVKTLTSPFQVLAHTYHGSSEYPCWLGLDVPQEDELCFQVSFLLLVAHTHFFGD